MQLIGMPAWKLTADCIRNAFRISGKKHLLLMGSRGIGKSTLLKKLAPDALPGSWLSAVSRCEMSESQWVSIDEIAFPETPCAEFLRAVQDLFEKKQVIAAVRKQQHPFLTDLLAREDAFVIDLDSPFEHTGCVIMASGLGKRFGGNKLMADFHGEPMIGRALTATACIPNRIVVTRHKDVADYCRERNAAVVLHALPYRSDTVRLGLNALPEIRRCLFCPGDQPLLSKETVMSLALLGNVRQDAILRPKAGDQPGTPMLFPEMFFPELCNLPQGKGGGFIAKKYPERVICLPIRDTYELMDADTPEELDLLIKH